MIKTLKQILQFIIGLLLLAVALLTIKYTFILGVLTIIIANIYKRRFIKGLAKIGTIFTSAAYCIDVLGCVILQVPLNLLFIIKGGYQFGSKHNTISYVLGVNEIEGTLSKVGKGLSTFLSFFRKDHCINTAKNGGYEQKIKYSRELL